MAGQGGEGPPQAASRIRHITMYPDGRVNEHEPFRLPLYGQSAIKYTLEGQTLLKPVGIR